MNVYKSAITTLYIYIINVYICRSAIESTIFTQLIPVGWSSCPTFAEGGQIAWLPSLQPGRSQRKSVWWPLVGRSASFYYIDWLTHISTISCVIFHEISYLSLFPEWVHFCWPTDLQKLAIKSLNPWENDLLLDSMDSRHCLHQRGVLLLRLLHHVPAVNCGSRWTHGGIHMNSPFSQQEMGI